MTMTKAKKSDETKVVEAHHPSSLPGKLSPSGGSRSDTWNNVVANQAVQTIWTIGEQPETRSLRLRNDV